MRRKEVNSYHENAVINNFIRYLKAQGRNVKLLCKPDPPDAIVKIDGKRSWIEVTDAFLCPEIAESITSYIASDKAHKPVPKESLFIVEPCQNFDIILRESINRKYQKMEPVYNKYGSGILLVGIQTPFSSAACLSLNKVQKPEQSNPQIFRKIYFYDTSGSAFFPVNVCNQGGLNPSP